MGHVQDSAADSPGSDPHVADSPADAAWFPKLLSGTSPSPWLPRQPLLLPTDDDGRLLRDDPLFRAARGRGRAKRLPRELNR